MTEGLIPPPIQTTGRYLVLLPEDNMSSGLSALSDSTGINNSDTQVFDRLGVAVVSLDPDRVQSLATAVAGDAPIIAIEPEQVMYATAGPSISVETASYLQGYKQGVSHLVDSFEQGHGRLVPPPSPRAAAFVDGTATWGLQATKVVDSSYSGAGVKVAVLDTGLDLTHPDFAGRTIDSQSFVAGEAVQDRQGHGTHCIGTACGALAPTDPTSPMRYGVAYNAEICVGKVLNNRGAGADGGIIGGIEWAIGKGCPVISMSLGGAVAPGAPFSVVYETLARRALAQGTLIIAAAGNSSNRASGIVNPVGRPANSPSILAVAAADSQLQIANFSDGSVNPNGGQVDIVAPGVNVYSTWSTDTAPSLPWEPPNPPSRYKTISGTSMATPHVAGIAALYVEATGKRGLELWALLMRDAQRLSLSSADVGAGLVQAPA